MSAVISLASCSQSTFHVSCSCLVFVRVPLQIARAASLRQSTAIREISVHSRVTARNRERWDADLPDLRFDCLWRVVLARTYRRLDAKFRPRNRRVTISKTSRRKLALYSCSGKRCAQFRRGSWKDASKRRLPPTHLTFLTSFHTNPRGNTFVMFMKK